MEKAKILIVEDDLNMGFLLFEFLESKGFETKLYRDGQSGLKGFEEYNFNLCLLDVMLPKMDGFALAKKIKALNKKMPIIMLTAKAMKEDKIKGFDIGIDDYITKPFDTDELYCRIKAVLSRSAPDNTYTIHKISQYQFDYKNQLLKFGNSSKRLTKKENEILYRLMGAPNQIVKRESLLLSLWGDNSYYNSRSLDVFITKLRKYLAQDPNIKIETIPTIGFMLSVNNV